MTDKTDNTEVEASTATENVENATKPAAAKSKPAKPKAKAPKKIVKVSQEVEPVVSAPAVAAPVATATAAATAPAKNAFQPQGKVKVIKGSILSPHNAGLRFVLNIANTAGKMESPLYPIFEKKWPKIKQEVRGSFVTKTGAYQLGTIANNTAVQSDVWCLSLLVQDDKLQTDLKAVEKSLKEVCKMAKAEKATCHISTLLTTLIPELADLATKELVSNGISVLYYEEPGV